MLASVFRRNQPAVLLGLLLIVPLLWMPGMLRGTWPGPGAAHMPLYQPLVWLMQRSDWVAPLLGMVFTIGIGAQLTALVGDAELMDRPNHLAALLFPLLLALIPGGMRMDAALAGTPLLLWALRRAWVRQDRGEGLGPLFHAGLLIGIAAMVYLPFIFMVVVIWASTAVMRPFHWRDHVVPLVAAALAFYLTWAILWLGNSTPWDPLATLTVSYRTTRWEIAPAFVLASLAILVPLGMATASEFSRSYRRSVMHGKNIRSALLAFTFASLLLSLFEFVIHRSVPSTLLAAPFAVLFAYPLLMPRWPWLAEMIVLALLAIAAWAQWAPLSSPA